MTIHRSLENLKYGRGRKRWEGKLSIPKRSPPLVKQLFELMNSQKTLVSDVSEKSGVGRTAILSWRTDRNPGLINFEATLNTIGYKLEIRPIGYTEEDRTALYGPKEHRYE